MKASDVCASTDVFALMPTVLGTFYVRLRETHQTPDSVCFLLQGSTVTGSVETMQPTGEGHLLKSTVGIQKKIFAASATASASTVPRQRPATVAGKSPLGAGSLAGHMGPVWNIYRDYPGILTFLISFRSGMG